MMTFVSLIDASLVKGRENQNTLRLGRAPTMTITSVRCPGPAVLKSLIRVLEDLINAVRIRQLRAENRDMVKHQIYLKWLELRRIETSVLFKL